MIATRSARAVAVGSLLLALAACGVDGQSKPRVIKRTDVPFGLARDPADTLPPTTAARAHAYSLYFVSGSGLVTVGRGSSTPVSPQAVVRALLRGPSRAESDAGLRTLLPGDLAVDGVPVRGAVATLRLRGQFGSDAVVTSRRLTLAQLVFTVTAIPGIDKIQVEVNGEKAEIPRGDGELTRRPVGRTDYPGTLAASPT